jgi:hypothetical protein
MKLITSIVLFGLGLVLSACSGNAIIGEGAVDEKCGLAPQSTIKMLSDQADATELAISLNQACMDKIQKQVQELIAQGKCDEITCPQQFKGAANKCAYEYAIAVNQPGVKSCGAQVLLVPAGVLPEDYVVNFAQGVDTDGDGVSNYDEYVGHSDPCNPDSLDVCQSDGVQDYDGDGLLNTKDPAPNCPGTQETPCI